MINENNNLKLCLDCNAIIQTENEYKTHELTTHRLGEARKHFENIE